MTSSLLRLMNPVFVAKKVKEHGIFHLLRTATKNRGQKWIYVAGRKAETEWYRFRNSSIIEQRRKVAEAAAKSEWSSFISKRDGFRLCQASDIPGLKEVQDYCWRVYLQRKDEAAAANQTYTSLLSPTVDSLTSGIIADLTSHRILQAFATSPPMTNIVADYLGEIPLIKDITLSVTHPNDTVEGSQRFHCDFSTRPHLKFYLAVGDIDEDNGPLTWISRKDSARVAKRTSYQFGRLEDSSISAVVDETQWHKLTGGPGTAAFVDTSQCLHFGSRRNKKDRVHFIIFYEPLYTEGAAKVSRDYVFNQESDPIRRLLIDETARV